MILVLVRDLMMSSKIIAAAREAGFEVKIVRDPTKLAAEKGQKLIVDLNQDGAIDAASAWKQASGGSAVGFVSHVDTATIERAKQAGIDRVMPRSQFVQVLPAILSGSID